MRRETLNRERLLEAELREALAATAERNIRHGSPTALWDGLVADLAPLDQPAELPGWRKILRYLVGVAVAIAYLQLPARADIDPVGACLLRKADHMECRHYDEKECQRLHGEWLGPHSSCSQ